MRLKRQAKPPALPRISSLPMGQMPSPRINWSSWPISTPRRSRTAIASFVASRRASKALAGTLPVTITINPAVFTSASTAGAASAITATSAPRSNSSRGFFLTLDSDDHAGAERFVRQRIDHDERARDAILRIRIEEQRPVRFDGNLADFVQFETRRLRRS
jgi:hypothetical protein